MLGQGVGRAFASGGDIKSVVHYISSTKDSERKIGESFLCASLTANWEAAHLEVPYVSFMDGITSECGVDECPFHPPFTPLASAAPFSTIDLIFG